MSTPSLSEFKSIITEDKFFQLIDESKFPIKNVDAMFCYKNCYGDKSLYYSRIDKEEYGKIVKKGNKDLYDFHIDNLFNKLIYYPRKVGSVEFISFRTFSFVNINFLCEYDQLISKIFKETCITYNNSLLEQIKSNLFDPLATYEMGKKHVKDLFDQSYFDYTTCTDNRLPEERCTRHSFDINNPIFFPSIVQERGIVEEKDKQLWESRTTNKQDVDAVITIKSIRFPVHSKVLKSKCEYFKIFFEGGFKESQNLLNIVLDDNIRPENFEKILYFIYTKDIDFKGVSLEDLFEITSYSQLIKSCGQEKEFEDLVHECVREYRRKLQKSTFWQILKDALTLQNDKLKMQCETFLKLHPKWIENNITSMEMSLEQLKEGVTLGTYLKNKEFVNACKKEIRESEGPK